MNEDIMSVLQRLEKLCEQVERLTAKAEATVALEKKEIWTAAEAAAYTGLSKDKLAEMARHHEISALQPGGEGTRYFFNQYDVKNWMQSCRISSDDEIYGKAALYCMKNPSRSATRAGKDKERKKA